MSTFTCTRLSTTCNQKAPMVSQGNIAPDLTLETDRSEKVTLSKLRGRQVVLFLPEGRHTSMEDRVQGQMMKAAAAWARGVHGVDSPAPLCRNVLSWTRPPACSVAISHRGISLPHVEERARHRKGGASCRTTRTRSRRGRPSEYAVNLGGHDEVVLMQSLDLLGLQSDRRIAPTEADIRMRAFSFREFTNLLTKANRLADIAKPEDPLDAVSWPRPLP